MNLTPTNIHRYSRFQHWAAVFVLVATVQPLGDVVMAETAAIDLPAPQTATNGALHYSRGLLFLDAVDPAKRQRLQKPYWDLLEALSDPGELEATNELLLESRHAIRAALVGASQVDADFGLEARHYVEAALVPHAHSMVDLSKLVLLHGMQLESVGDWDGAAEVYAGVARMGRHMTHQTTLIEALMGVEILEGAYYALGRWAVHCPDSKLVEQASLMVNVLAREMVHPAQTLSYEMRYVKQQLARMRESFPDGPWASMILAAVDKGVPPTDQSEIREAAIAAAAQRGIPSSVFHSKEAFQAHVDKLRSVHIAMARATAATMTLPTKAAVKRGQQVYEKYAPKLHELGDPEVLNPGQMVAFFGTHDAELTLLKVVLALAADRTEEGFPASLDTIARRFGGQVPRSPYDGSELTYKVVDGGGFNVAVNEVKVGDIELPKIEFNFVP